MPNLQGRRLADARRALEQIGAVPLVRPVVDGRAEAGTVLATEPAAGTAAPSQVTLVVADGGAVLPLADLPPADGSSCGTSESVTVNGKTVGKSPSCTPSSWSSDGAHVEYVLGRHALFLQGRFGTNDAEGRGSATIRILNEKGKLLRRVEVGLGQPKSVRISVKGVLRLRIEVKSAATGSEPEVVLGNARLIGQPADIDQIPTQ